MAKISDFGREALANMRHPKLVAAFLKQAEL
jgi:hypothetical protein